MTLRAAGGSNRRGNGPCVLTVCPCETRTGDYRLFETPRAASVFLAGCFSTSYFETITGLEEVAEIIQGGPACTALSFPPTWPLGPAMGSACAWPHAVSSRVQILATPTAVKVQTAPWRHPPSHGRLAAPPPAPHPVCSQVGSARPTVAV